MLLEQFPEANVPRSVVKARTKYAVFRAYKKLAMTGPRNDGFRFGARISVTERGEQCSHPRTEVLAIQAPPRFTSGLTLCESSHMSDPMYFATARAFRQWLARHSSTAAELIVGFHKVNSGTPSMSWPESVDEALCVGWIDGVRRRIDDTAYQIRFTPRKPGSIWSAVNIAKYEQLLADGRIQPAGAAAFARRKEEKSRVYAYEQDQVAELTAEEWQLFRSHTEAWRYFETTPASYRKVLLHWIATAKKPETRAARLAKLMGACADGVRLR